MSFGVDYDFIEIGTSDFDTLIQSCPHKDRGLCVEPLSFYLDRLPNKPNVRKVHAAISDKDGEIEIFFLPPETT